MVVRWEDVVAQYLSLGACWYGRGRLSSIDMVVWWGDVVAGYLHSVGPGGSDDLRAVALVVGRDEVDWGGNVRVR
jgi:hypothetical protein